MGVARRSASKRRGSQNHRSITLQVHGSVVSRGWRAKVTENVPGFTWAAGESVRPIKSFEIKSNGEDKYFVYECPDDRFRGLVSPGTGPALPGIETA